MGAQAPHRIVVVGGGAGGVELATRLGDRLGRRGRAQVTLVDRSRTPGVLKSLDSLPMAIASVS